MVVVDDDNIDYLDSLIKEYLLFRGFFHTIQLFDQELKHPPPLNPDQLSNNILHLVNHLNLNALLSLWSTLSNHVFSSISSCSSSTFKLMEHNLFKYFMISAIQQNHPDKITEFLKSIDFTTTDSQEWMVWSALVYIKNPASTPPFELYFTKTWQDQFTTSLRNFLERVLTSIPLPRLLNFNMDRIQRMSLLLENSKLQDSVQYWRRLANSLKPAAIQACQSPITTPTTNHHLNRQLSSTSTPVNSTTADDEPYMILDDICIRLAYKCTRCAISPDAKYLAIYGSFHNHNDNDQLVVRVYAIVDLVRGLEPIQFHAQCSAGLVAELVWIDHVKLLIVFQTSVKLLEITSSSKLNDIVSDLDLTTTNDILSASTLLRPNLVAMAGPSRVFLVQIGSNRPSSLSLLAHHELLDSTGSVLHITNLSSSGVVSTVGVVTYSYVHIFDIHTTDLYTIQLVRSIEIPNVPQCSFVYATHPTMLLAVMSELGTMHLVNCESGCLDPLQTHQFKDLRIPHLRMFAVDYPPPPPTTTGTTSSSRTTSSPFYLLVGNQVFSLVHHHHIKHVQSFSPLSSSNHHQVSSVRQSMASSALALTYSSNNPTNNKTYHPGQPTISTTITTNVRQPSSSSSSSSSSELGMDLYTTTTTTSCSSSVILDKKEKSHEGSKSVANQVTCVAKAGNLIVLVMESSELRVMKVLGI